jgi:hypothetical protein
MRRGISIGSPINTSYTVSLVGDAMTIGAPVTAGQILISPNNFGVDVDLGSGSSSLVLDQSALNNLQSSFLQISGNTINVNSPIVTAVPGDLYLSGATVNVAPPASIDTTAGSITICCGTANISGPVTANSGIVTLNVDNPVITAPVRTTGGGNYISVYPSSQIGISLGAVGTYLDDAELALFNPGSGLLRVGDFSNTRNIALGAISDHSGSGLTLLSLITGNGAVTQSGAFAGPNLAVRANFGISLPLNNLASTVSLQADSGDVAYTYAGASPLAISNLDGVLSPGVHANFFFGNVTLRTDQIAINEEVRAGNSVTLVPFTPNRPVDLGTKNPATLGVATGELDRIFTGTLVIGDGITPTGPVTVSAPYSATTFSNLTITTPTNQSVTFAGGSDLTVPGNLAVTTGSFSNNSTVTAGSSIAISADAMDFNAAVTALSVSLAPVNPTTPVDLGGSDGVASAILGLDSGVGGDISNLHAYYLAIGNNATASIAVTQPTALSAVVDATLTTKSGGPINVGATLSNTSNLTLNGGGSAAIAVNRPLSSSAGSLAVNTGSGGSIVANGTLSAPVT